MTVGAFDWPTIGQPWTEGERLSDILSAAPLIVYAMDLDGIIRMSTGGGLAQLGYRPGELVGRSVFEMVPHSVFNDHHRRALTGEQFDVVVESGGRTYETRFAPAYAENGELTGAYGIAVEITDEAAVRRSLRTLTDIDTVTQLHSRQATEAEIDRTLATGTELALLLVDLDDFKDVNDTHGHVLGDLVLRQLGRRLRATAPHDALVGRMGGDELVVAVPAGKLDKIAQLADLMLDVVAGPLRIDLSTPLSSEPVDMTITASIGIAVSPRDGSSAAQLMTHADSAMYAAKRSGGATYCFYDNRIDGARRRLTMITKLRRAVADEALYPVFQPVRDLNNNRVAGFEALARWHDPELGQVPPTDFIAIAERSPLIDDLFDSILRQSLAAAVTWYAAQGQPDRHLAINIAARQLRDPELTDRIVTAARRAGHPIDLICAELTETAMMDDEETAHQTLASMSDAGIRVYIDDFGVGYSNVARLTDLASAGILAGIKVDRRFIADPAESRTAALLQLFRHMSETFGAEIVIEGIETDEHLRVARRMNYRFGQGWHLGRPESAEVARALTSQ